jgi:alpha-L-rhamnosidase
VVIAALVLAGSSAPGVAVATSGSTHGSTASAPTGLRADGQAADVLIGRSQPTFAWTVNDSGRAQAQTGYQVRVESDRGRTVWDSQRVSSPNSTSVRYDGPALASDHGYKWSVRTWNSRGERSAWSKSAPFDVGLLGPSDWSAWWLQAPDGALLRSEFTVTKTVARARLYLGAQGLVEPHLNGSRVEPTRVLDSSVTDYDTRVLYRDLDVTKQVKRGANTLALMIGKGQFTRSPMFVAQLDVTYTDGSVARFGTDPNWRTIAGPVVGNDFYNGEKYDARKEIAGWDATGTDISGWAAAHAVAPASHQQSLAKGKPVTALDSTDCCGWSRAALTDGVDGSSDASEGYHSASAPNADSTRWVQTDLGSATDIRLIRLFPARPSNDPAGDFLGAGFPVRYQVQVSDDPTFATATTVVDHTDADQPNPGTTAVELPTRVTARYLRVTANKLYCNPSGCNFRLAELGVYGAAPPVAFSSITQLQADSTPPTRVVANLAPVKETRVGAKRVYDFGQNHTGWVTLRAALPAGTTVDIKKGEILDTGGEVSTTNINFGPGDAPRQVDHYIFAGSGTETYAPHFNYSGFRYAELTGLPEDAKVTVTAQVEHNDVATTGRFSTSNPLLNQIQAAVTQTQLNALQSIPVDCPTREKHGWLGDAGDSDLEAMANFDMESFYAKWLGDVVTSANQDGSLPSVAPTNGLTDWRTDPAWGSAYPQIIWDSYLEYGNKEVIETHYAQVRAWVDYLATISDTDRVVVNAPTTWGEDWVSTVGTPHQFFQTGFSYLDAVLLSKMAAATGRSADATKYAQVADQVAAGFTKRFFNPETGNYANGSQLSFALPLALGLVPAGREQATVDHLLRTIAAADNHVTTGFVGTTFVFQALGKYHRNDVALAIAERTDYPSFGYMVQQGPGTIWEKWPNSSAPDGTSSKDHIGLGGAIGQWFYQQLAGIQPGTGAAYRNFTLAPSVVGDLTNVSAKQQTVRGTIESSWRRDGSTVTYHAKVPVGATATIELPLLGGRRSTVRENGKTIFANGRGSSGAGLSVGAATDETLTVTAGSGDYTFTVLPPSTSFTRLTLTTTGTPAPLRPGAQGEVTALLSARSSAKGSVGLSLKVPAGWTATPTQVPLIPATTATRVSLQVTVPSTAVSGQYPLQLTARAPDGTTAVSTVPVIVFGRWPAGSSVAASSEHAPNTVDGQVRTYLATNAIDENLRTFWNDDTDGAWPDSLTLTLPTATALHGIGFASSSDGVPTDFTVQTWDGADWVNAATVAGNTEVVRWIPFAAPVSTSQLRIVVTAAQNSFTRIAEVTP